MITRHEFHEFPRTKGAEDMALRLKAKKRSKRLEARIIIEGLRFQIYELLMTNDK